MDLENFARDDIPRKKTYSSQFLMSLAGTDSCRKPPPNINLREINSEISVEDIPEWRRRASTPSPTGKHGQRRRNRLSHSLSDSFRSQGKAEEHVSTFPTKNRVNKKPGDSSVKHEPSRQNISIELQGSDHPRPHYGKLFDNDIKTNVSPVLTSSDSENSDLSISSPNHKIDLEKLFVLEKNRVLPMPAAPTLEEVEKNIKAADFLTCQDVEKSILTVPQALVSTATSNSSGREQWLDAEDKAASKHILSLLQGKQFQHFTDQVLETQKAKVGELTGSNLIEALKRQENEIVAKRDSSTNLRLMYTDTVDSVRTTVKQTSDNLVLKNADSKTKSPAATTLWQNIPSLQQKQQQQQMWQNGIKHPTGGLLRPPPMTYSTPPNTYLQTRPVAVGTAETPLVPVALQALQRLVDHQLHILNSIPGEVTPGMLHQRLSRSVLGYPATGTHVLLATTCAPAHGYGAY